MALDYDAHATVDGGMIKFSGVDFSNGSKPLLVIKRTKSVLVMKVPGRKVWNGRFSPNRYAPAEYIVYKILRESGRSLTLERIVDFPCSVKAAK